MQEFLLQEILKTDLANCRLLAEEDTPSVNKFNERGKYYLVLDPIDNTAIYARGGRDFCVIVSLHDGKKPLYTFVYFPALNWTHRMVHNTYTVTKQSPNFTLPPGAESAIIYWAGNPEKTIPKLYNDLKKQGLNFATIPIISRDFGSIAMLACNKVAGIYREDPNVYDGLVELHMALAKGLKIYSGGPNGALDLSDIKKRESGLYYPGYYLALNMPV